MQTKFKLLLLVSTMLLALGVVTTINVSINFRDFSIKSSIEKAKMTASIVKDGLTAHMVNGIMDKRNYFLNKISTNNNIKSLWIVRSDKVIKQYGPARANETIRDKIDSDVLKYGTMIQKITEKTDGIELRITIPYKAIAEGNPDCLSCHTVNRGDTLGAISMEFDISGMRNTGIFTILKIFGINLLFIIIVLFLLNYYVTPYMKLFSNLQVGIKKAYRGDFTHEFTTTVIGDGKELVEQINPLFRKIQSTFGDIKYDLSTFIPNNCVSSSDPLHEAKVIIQELSDIYKFKKTIELDESKEIVYSRLIDILKTKFNIENFSFYEVESQSQKRELIYSTHTTICNSSVNSDANQCRAFRTNNEVLSTDFINLCQHCSPENKEYICIPFIINNDYSLVISITSSNLENINSVTSNISSIENYLEAAKPVIESKILMGKLLDTSLRDAMTGLYNRRFLEEFIDKVMSQALREKGSYSVLMLDVDFFKMVNDTYGHDVGDKVIVEIGKLIRSSIREADLGIRYGGEEFVVMLHNADEVGTLKVAQTIHDNFGELVFDAGNGAVLQKTMSIGVSKFPTDGNTIWKAIKYADTALYVAKTTGRDKIVEYKKEMSESEATR
ncbi:MAG: GGDEF domain-containing protein [Sulfurimonas sp.]